MTRVARPLSDARYEEGKKHPEGGKEYTDALEKRMKEIKEKSALEKKQCSMAYRHNLSWADINNQDDFDKKYHEVYEDYHSGKFFLERIGRYREVDVPLTMVLVQLRQEWIKEYEIKTTPEFVLVDMALTSYFHFLRLNEDINNIMANIEWQVFALDAPSFARNCYRDSLSNPGKDKMVAEELAHKLNEVLRPTLDQYNRLFIRNLKALRDLKRGNIQLNIGNVGQMNIGDKQINVENKEGI